MTFSKHYALLISVIIRNGFLEKNARTGERVKVIPGGRSFQFSIGKDQGEMMPFPGNRKIFPYIAAAEIAWYVSGSRDVRWLQQHAKIWNKFVESDGFTIKNAYGYRWRKAFGRDQLGGAVQQLRDNPTSRQILVTAWDPRTDGDGTLGEKNVPCPTQFTLNLIDHKLHSSLFIRSSDVFVGLPYDVLGHALLMKAISKSVGCDLGTMHVTLANAHLYEKHLSMAAASLMYYEDADDEISRPLPDWSLEQIESNADMYVENMKRLTQDLEWPNFNPKPEIIV